MRHLRCSLSLISLTLTLPTLTLHHASLSITPRGSWVMADDEAVERKTHQILTLWHISDPNTADFHSPSHLTLHHAPLCITPLGSWAMAASRGPRQMTRQSNMRHLRFSLSLISLTLTLPTLTLHHASLSITPRGSWVMADDEAVEHETPQILTLSHTSETNTSDSHSLTHL